MMFYLLLECSVRAVLIAAAAGLLCAIMRVRQAAARHRVYAGMMLAMLALPLWTALGPRVALPVLNRPVSRGVYLLDRNSVPPAPSPARIGPVSPPAAHPDLLAILYSLGVCVLLTRLAIGTFRARRLRARAAVRDGVHTSLACSAPVTVGWLHPVAILPVECLHWPAAALDAVLAHEREHMRRRDPLVQWLALLNRAIFWFHPVAWWLERRLSALAEEACDAAVVAGGVDPREYCESLLRCARSVQRGGARIGALGVAMSGSSLAGRLRLILEAAPPQMPRRRAVGMALAGAAACALFGAAAPGYRDQDGSRPAFEVASVKPQAGSGSREFSLYSPGGKFTAANVTLRRLIEVAYQVESYRLSGGPSWMATDGFDVDAKAGDGAIAPGALDRAKIHQLALMLQTLLADRFHLKLHRETKDGKIYVLMTAKGGPKLQPAAGDCPVQSTLSNPGCGDFSRISGAGFLIGPRVSTQDVADALSKFIVSRPVVDKTGIKGNFNVNLTWTADRFRNVDVNRSANDNRSAKEPGPDPNGPSLFTALQEQLGLRLDTENGPIEYLIVDSAERPVAN